MIPLELKAIKQIDTLLGQHIQDLHKLKEICRGDLKAAYEKSPEIGYPDRVDIDTFNSFQGLITKIDAIKDWTSILKEEK